MKTYLQFLASLLAFIGSVLWALLAWSLVLVLRAFRTATPVLVGIVVVAWLWWEFFD